MNEQFKTLKLNAKQIDINEQLKALKLNARRVYITK